MAAADEMGAWFEPMVVASGLRGGGWARKTWLAHLSWTFASGWRLDADAVASYLGRPVSLGAFGCRTGRQYQAHESRRRQSFALAASARALGLGLMIGGNVESSLGMTASACFAAGLGGFEFADLDTPLFLADNPFAGGMRCDGGRIILSEITAGHGVIYLPRQLSAPMG